MQLAPMSSVAIAVLAKLTRYLKTPRPPPPSSEQNEFAKNKSAAPRLGFARAPRARVWQR
jgi:hypothetical protein